MRTYEETMYCRKTFFEYKLKIISGFLTYHTLFPHYRQPFGKENAAAAAAAFDFLLPAEGLAVSALILSRIHFMGAHQNAVQGAIVLAVAVVCTLLNGAFDALICMTVHISSSFFWFLP